MPAAFDYFAPPVRFGTACSTPLLVWSGAPTLRQSYTVTTQNLGGNSQLLLVDWSNQPGQPYWQTPRPPGCPIYVGADSTIALGTMPSYTFLIPNDQTLIGVRLRTQAVILVSPLVTTQGLKAKIGE